MVEQAQAIKSADAGKLQASAAAPKDRCRAGGGVEAALFDVHEGIPPPDRGRSGA